VARTTGSVGAAKRQFETEWHRYCDEYPEFEPGYIAAKMMHGFADKQDSTRFFGALTVLAKLLSSSGDGADEGAQTPLIIDRRQAPLEFKPSTKSIGN